MTAGDRSSSYEAKISQQFSTDGAMFIIIIFRENNGIWFLRASYTFLDIFVPFNNLLYYVYKYLIKGKSTCSQEKIMNKIILFLYK